MTIARDAILMIIDHERENLGVLESMLTRQGYTVHSFPTGPAALESAREQPPDLILLDSRMPAVNGTDICTHLKSIDRLKLLGLA